MKRGAMIVRWVAVAMEDAYPVAPSPWNDLIVVFSRCWWVGLIVGAFSFSFSCSFSLLFFSRLLVFVDEL